MVSNSTLRKYEKRLTVIFVDPGIGMMSSPWAMSQAKATCPGVALYFLSHFAQVIHQLDDIREILLGVSKSLEAVSTRLRTPPGTLASLLGDVLSEIIITESLRARLYSQVSSISDPIS